MIKLIPAKSRGLSRYRWLDSFHSFSFAHYYDPARMGVSHLRVLNEDTVEPGRGFGTHPHKNMEIISYVLEGTIKHKDSEGNKSTLQAGEFQLMSAGRGIDHSEYNASDAKNLKFLQIWIEPDRPGGAPTYQQKNFGQKSGLTKIVSPDGDDGSFKIKQQATMNLLILKPTARQTFSAANNHDVYIHLIEGELNVEQHELGAGDALHIKGIENINLVAQGEKTVRALVFDLG